MLKFVQQYFDTFLFETLWEFNSFQFNYTISYTYLKSNITYLPLTYHIRMSSLEFYVHHTTFSISGKCFVPHNQILCCRCNIGTNSHLLFTTSPSSKFQECFGKVIYPLQFLQFHTIVILIMNEWFVWIHTILIWNRKTLLFSFHDFILPHPSPIILLILLCHLFCLDFSLFFNPITYLPLSMLRHVGILLVLHNFLQCLRLGMYVAVDDTIEETNAPKFFELTGKALYHSTTTRVCCMYKKKCSPPIRPVSTNIFKQHIKCIW